MFGERLESIEPDPNWKIPAIPKELTDWLANRVEIDEKILDHETLDHLAEAWFTSLEEAFSSGRKIPKSQKLRSLTDVVGHVINLGTCIEAIINHHLFLTKESGKLSLEHYIV